MAAKVQGINQGNSNQPPNAEKLQSQQTKKPQRIRAEGQKSDGKPGCPDRWQAMIQAEHMDSDMKNIMGDYCQKHVGKSLLSEHIYL